MSEFSDKKFETDIIFEYDVGKKSKLLKNKSLYRNFSFHPLVLTILANVLVFMFLAAIGFGVGLEITSRLLRTYGEACHKDNECDFSLHLRCQDARCNCTTDKYYKSAIEGCINKFGNLAECSINQHCSGEQLCTDNKCQCTADRWWNSSTAYCQKKSEYAEYCLNISNCVDGKNLVCKSSKCICSNPNIVYWNGTYCDLVQTHLGSCKIHEACNSSQKLVCNNTETQPNKCTCTAFEYWDSTNKICTSQKSINQTCLNTNECKSFTGLYCGSTPKKCICETDYYWSSTACIQKNTYGEKCGVCDDTVLLSCNSSNFCDCSGTNFWNGTYCVPPITVGMNCENNWDCDTSKGLTCSYSTTPHKCICSDFQYWNSLKCVDKKVEGVYCQKNIECQEDKGLICDINLEKCVCKLPNQYWSNGCHNKKLVNVACTDSKECRNDLGLSCSLNAVPQYKYCRCNSTQYWTNTCVNKKSNASLCNTDEECANHLGLICDEVCKCTSWYYWDTSLKKCVIKKLGNETCNSDWQCHDYFGYHCLNDTTGKKSCQCPPRNYFNNRCWPKVGLDGPCTGLYGECADYLGLDCYGGLCRCDQQTSYWDAGKCQIYATVNKYCDDSNVKCNYITQGLICKNAPNVCQCPSSQTWSEQFQRCHGCTDMLKYYDGFNCFLRVKERDSCSYDEMCLIPMTCASSTKTCVCPLYKYHKGNLCVPQGIENATCYSHYECRLDLNLKCNTSTNKCECNLTYTWSSIQNSCKKTHHSSCVSANDCNLSEKLICNISVCDCIKKTGNESFWDASRTECVSARPHNDPCTSDSHCQTLTQLTKCIGNICDCAQVGGFTGEKCKTCRNDEVYSDGKCYYFSTDTIEAVYVDTRCKNLIGGRAAVIRSGGALSVIKTKAGAEAFWISGELTVEGSSYDYSWLPVLDNQVTVFSPCTLSRGENCLYLASGCIRSNKNCLMKLRYICEY